MKRQDNIIRACLSEILQAHGEAHLVGLPDGLQDMNCFWIMVEFSADEKMPEQGWKLHVSATPQSAASVLRACAEELFYSRTPFKVISDVSYLNRLDSPFAPRSQVGKFITVYPRNDIEAIALAGTLDRVTVGLPGPRIPSDRPLHAHSLVHYRYGAFKKMEIIDETGQIHYMKRSASGVLEPDVRQPWFERPSSLQDPFEAANLVIRAADTGPIGQRYRVKHALGQQAKGGTYLADDFQTGSKCVIKEARQYVQVDALGRDARDRLTHEHAIFEGLADFPWMPKVLDFFSQEDNVYLVTEYFPSQSLRNYVALRVQVGDYLSEPEVQRLFEDMIRILADVHCAGILYRDVTPNNFLISGAGEVRLIDFELAVLVNDQRPPFQKYTPGYASPQQRDSQPPSVTDDIYSLGCVLFFLLTGRDPYFGPDCHHAEEKVVQLLQLIRPTASRHWGEIIRQCLNQEAQSRYQTVHGICPESGHRSDPAVDRLRILGQPQEPALLPNEQAAFLKMAIDVGNCLCKTPSSLRDAPCFWKTNSYIGQASIPTNINSGACGISLFLADLYAHTSAERYKATVELATQWLLDQVSKRESLIPSLYFGDGGIPCLLLRLYRVTGEAHYLDKAAQLGGRLQQISRLPDLVHGAAGQGLMFLSLAVSTSDDTFLKIALEIGDILCASAEEAEDGIVWKFPERAPAGFGHRIFYGFAHGNAGIGYYLLELFRVTGHGRYLRYAKAAAATLLSVARKFLPSGEGLNWESEPHNERFVTYWCSGASGIGQFFANAYRVTQDPVYLDTARRAARTVMAVSPVLPMGQCHGIAGNGDYLMDLHQILQEKTYYQQALHLGRIIRACSYQSSRKAPAWPGDGTLQPTPDYMVGNSGTASFLLRLAYPESPRPMTLDYFAAIPDHRAMAVTHA